jgi:uncharacterized repeat protein (TIGR01451 family)
MPVPSVNITVFLNTAITSRLYSNGWSEALLLVNEPGSGLGGTTNTQLACADPNGICLTTATGTGAGDYDGTTGRPNLFQGVVAGNAVTFSAIPVDPPGAGKALVFRIVNIRANATALSAGVGMGATPAVASIAVSNPAALPLTNPTPTVAFVAPGMNFSVRTPDNLAVSSGFSVVLCSSSGTPQRAAVLRFSELLGVAFQSRTVAPFVDNNTSPTPVPQNIPGQIYNVESGFYNPALTSQTGNFATIGLADAGTRLRAVLNNIPAGTSVYVSANRVNFTNGNPLAATTGGVARLIQNEATSFVPLSPTVTLGGIPAIQLQVTNGSAVAVWEVLRSDPSIVEDLDFPVWVLPAGIVSGSATITGTYAPAPPTFSGGGSASSTSPLPRFLEALAAHSLFTQGTCVTSLSITKTHTGSFMSGQTGANFTVTVNNVASAPTSGTVTVTETLPSGMGLVSMGGAGWTCPSIGASCTRSDVLAGGTSYPAIMVTVNVAGNASSPLVNRVSVTGGGSAGANASDSVTITPSSNGTGHFGGNGLPDLIWQADASRQVTVHYFGAAGGAAFQGWDWLNAGGVPGWTVVAAADFDGNGVPDLVWMNNQTRQVTVHYYGGTAGATFQGWNWLNAGGVAGWTVVGAADFDGNGTPDLIWQNDATRQVTVHYYGGAGGATFQGWNWLNAGGVAGWTVAGAADFDGNGIPDLIWQNNATRQVTVHYYGGAGGATFQGWNYLNAAGIPGWTVAGANDFDGNGVPDLVWQNDSTRQVTVHYYGGAQGATFTGWQFLNSAGVPGWHVVVPH